MNEEDIKILEDLLNRLKYNISLGVVNEWKPNETFANAIENLINRNKELEEDYTSVYLSGFYDGENKWKSKIKGKIKELKEKGESDLRTYGFAIETHLAKQVLEEFLQEGENNANI